MICCDRKVMRRLSKMCFPLESQTQTIPAEPCSHCGSLCLRYMLCLLCCFAWLAVLALLSLLALLACLAVWTSPVIAQCGLPGWFRTRFGSQRKRSTWFLRISANMPSVRANQVDLFFLPAAARQDDPKKCPWAPPPWILKR